MEMCNCRLNCQMRSKEEAESDGTIVIGVSVHCQGCEYMIRKCLWCFEGVESVEIDTEKNIAKVKGKRVDPRKIAEKLRKKTGKTVQIISSPKPPGSKKDDKKDQKEKEPIMIEVHLKIYLHCDGCMKDAKRCLHKFPGVQSVKIDMEKNLCIVKGTFEPKKLVQYMEESTGKNVEIIKKKEQIEILQQEQQECSKKCCFEYQYNDPKLVFGSELFSEENSNSCSVM